MKVMSLVSTRPEIIKMAPVIKAIEKEGMEHVFVTTGQHYDFMLFDEIITDLKLPKPDYNLAIGSGTPGLQIGIGMLTIERILDKEHPHVVLSEGDTNSVLAAALAAHKNGYIFGHVEAGLRSRDMTMPEESNRILSDHISNFLFAPTMTSKKNLLEENLDEERIFVTGNTVVDATLQYLPIAEKESRIMEKIAMDEKDYILVTYHRAENTTPEKMKKFLDIVEELCNSGEKVLFPAHPRTKNLMISRGMMKRVKNIKNFILSEPFGYLDFLLAMKNSKLILTDSGGLQEEATILKVPTLIMRNNTERPEALGLGCELVGLDKNKIMELVQNPPKVIGECPFGKGNAGEQIARILADDEKTERLRFKTHHL